MGIETAGDSRLFVVERTGRIRIIDGANNVLATPFLDITSIVESEANERGLLALAFHPNYPATPYFYVLYTTNNPGDVGDVRIARYSVSANPNVANAGSGVVLLEITHQLETNHNGGTLAFGPDGYLYASIGDGGGGGDPQNNAQNLNSHLGKILRFDVNQNVNTPPYYAVPASNPFASVAGLDEIWAYGLRNPWRMSFDSLTGELYIADVGQVTREEVTVQPASSPGGQNYGWRIMEGNFCYTNELPGCNHASFTPPAFDYVNGSNCSITGGYVYRGATAAFQGTYIYGDLCSGIIWGAEKDGSVWSSTQFIDTAYFLTTFGQDSAGELYLADYFGGTIQRILLADTDNDGIPDGADNCPNDANPAQEHSDRNFFDQTPPLSQDDRTRANSDATGDACDTDDDNDGRSDAAEAAGCNATGPTLPTNMDSDGDGFHDGAECARSTNPNSAASKPGTNPAATPSCGPTSDADGDRIMERIEVCAYNTNPIDADTDDDMDGATPGLTRDGCEIVSINTDRVVNSQDQLLLALEFIRVQGGGTLLRSIDLNKDTNINSLDQLLMAQVISPPGACP